MTSTPPAEGQVRPPRYLSLRDHVGTQWKQAEVEEMARWPSASPGSGGRGDAMRAVTAGEELEGVALETVRAAAVEALAGDEDGAA